MKRVVIVAAVLVACSKKGAMPAGLYCEGGVINGRGDGGECITITPDGKATLQSNYTTPYVLQRDGTSKSRFFLLNGGATSGTLEVNDGDWITVTIDGHAYKMRSDAPGALI